MSTEELYREIVEGSSDGIWVFDLSGATIYANPTLARMFGVTQDEFTRLTVFDSLDDDGQEQFAAHLRDLAVGRAQERDMETAFKRSDGTRMWVLVGETLLRGPDGEITGVLHRITDFDERRALVDRLTASRHELAESQRIARLGSWTWDLETDEIVGSEALYRLYGREDPEAPVPYADFLARVHPDDLTEVEAAVERARTTGGEFVFVARIRTDDDELVWTRGRGVAHRDDSGRVVSMTGTHQDITETRKAELALEDQVAQNLLMQAVASAANEASTLNEVLGQARTLVLLHDDWRRARGFGRSADGSRLEPMYLDERDRLDDLDTAEESALELALAHRAAESRTLLWDDKKLTVAFPVMYGDEVQAVITITSSPPLYRYDLIESFVRQSAVQLTRVVERELAERALADARDAAMEASRQKSDFLARMSHEIRTPLNGVIGLNELLLRTDMDGEQLRLASGVKAASRSLLDLINDILDFSKIEAGMLELERVSFDVREVLDQATAVLSESADARDITLTVDCEASVPALVAGDPVRLGQVVMNLGANAVKFTPQGRVRMLASATEQDGHVVLRVDVSDTGVGVEGLDLESLFESFNQGDASTTRVHGGTGLGLAISREIVEAMGGQIGAEARPQGGSLFWFTVTLDAIDEADTSVPRWHAESGTGLAAAPGRLEGGVRPRILVVEDNPVNQVVAVGLLRSLGYDADTADDGVAGLAAWADGCYDLVLMDVQMPRMDGYATTREIRRTEPEGRRVPVLAMTAAAIQGERERCLEAGMDDFLTKPVDLDALAAALAHWLGHDAPVERVAPPAREPVADGLDRDRLDMLRDMADGDTAYLDRAIGRFVAGTPDLVVAIGAAVSAGDVDDLRQQAHRLAGSALNLGVTRAGMAARALEHLADTGTTAGADDLLPRLAEAVDADCAALLTYQQGYQVAQG
jgi:PAS domain S-box-containing protein